MSGLNPGARRVLDDGLTQHQGILLIRESDSAKHLLAYGLRALRLSAFHDTTRDPVLSMLSIGVEKLLKVSLGLIHLDEHREWPTQKTFRTVYRHDIVTMERLLRDRLRIRATRATHPRYFDPLLASLDADPVWRPIVEALHRYGDQGRFYYLDALAGATPVDDSPEVYWDKVDAAARDADPELERLFHASIHDYALHDVFMTGLNKAAADSLQQWWSMIAMAGKQGLMGARGVLIGTDQETIGRQVIDETRSARSVGGRHPLR